jgi:hypothetical protein
MITAMLHVSTNVFMHLKKNSFICSKILLDFPVKFHQYFILY